MTGEKRYGPGNPRPPDAAPLRQRPWPPPPTTSSYPHEPVPPADERQLPGDGVWLRVAIALVALTVAAGVLAGVVSLFGCAGQQRPRMAPEHARVVAVTVATWRERGMPFTALCVTVMREAQVLVQDACDDHAWGCVLIWGGKRYLVLHPKNPSPTSTLVHEVSHLLHRCGHFGPRDPKSGAWGDPAHESPWWRQRGVDPRVDARPEAVALRRVNGWPEPAPGGVP